MPKVPGTADHPELANDVPRLVHRDAKKFRPAQQHTPFHAEWVVDLFRDWGFL